MKKLLIAVCLLLILLLGTNTIWFCYLDKKMNKAIDKQNEINSKVHETLSNQEQTIRVVETNSEIMFNVLIHGDFIQEEDYEKH